MDTTDPDIYFDNEGICNHCSQFVMRLASRGYVSGRSELEWVRYADTIKRHGTGNDYDCIVGVSGGVDSTYAAYLCKQHGLRALLIHMDNGWDTEIAVSNIREASRALGFDYVSYVIEWQHFRDVQMAFLKSSSVDLEMPTDIGILATIYEVAVKHNIKYIISGGNLASEGILPIRWGYHRYKDMIMYRHIVRTYSSANLHKIPTIGLLKEAYYRLRYRIKTLYVLNYIDYNKDSAKEFLINNLKWKDYGGIHHESKITAFWQGYVMNSKYNMDYRRPTFSSQICKGQMTRDLALELLSPPAYNHEKVLDDMRYIAKKFGIEVKELEYFLSLPPKTYVDFPNSKFLIDLCYSFYNKHFNHRRV